MKDESEGNEASREPRVHTKSKPVSEEGDFNSDIQGLTAKDNRELPQKSKSESDVKHKIEDYDMVVGRLKDAASSFKEGFISMGKRAQEIKDRAGETFTVGAKKDAREIRALGAYADNVIKGYEDTMSEINKKNYSDQEKLLKGYKKLLEEQINLINARIELVKRLKTPDK